MRVILLSTAVGMRPGAIVVARDQLGIRPDDELVLVSLFRPRSAVPASRHLMVRPGSAQELAVAPAVTPLVPPAAEGSADAAVPGVSEPLVPGGPEPSAHEPPTSEPPTSGVPTAVATAPRRSLRSRVRTALGRLRRSRWTRRVTGSKRVRTTYTAALQIYRSWRFVIGTIGSAEVRRLVEDSDLVVSADVPANRAGWFLARRHRQPHVVVGYAAGRRVLDARDG